MKYFKKLQIFLVAVIIVVCSAVFTGCTGSNGRDGRDANVLLGLILELWDSDEVNQEDYEGGLLEFISLYFRGETGAPGVPGNLSTQSAAALAVRSAVDVVATVSYSSNNYPQNGAGVIYQLEYNSSDVFDYGFIITNYHVVSRVCGTSPSTQLVVAQKVNVYLYGMSSVPLPAFVLGGSDKYDIAVLQISGSTGLDKNYLVGGSNVNTVAGVINKVDNWLRPAREFLPSRPEPALGAQVFAVGNPLGDGMSVTDGIVSVQTETLTMTSIDEKRDQDFRVMRISAAVNPGNSGGGVFNQSGELVGIVQARAFTTSATDGKRPVDNIAYAIPNDIALRIVNQIIERKGEYTSGNIVKLGEKSFDTAWQKFSVKSIGITVKLELGEMITEETVAVERRGTSGLSTNAVIWRMTVNGKDYNITKTYQVYDLLIEGYTKTVTFN